jgi:hypothetical protein
MLKIHKIIIYRILLVILALSALVLLIDILMPLMSQQDFITDKNFIKHSGRSGSYTNFIFHTSRFQFESDNMFYYRVVDSLPITIYYSPLFKIVKKAEGVYSDDPTKTIATTAKNSIYTTFWFIPLIVFIISVLGLFINDEAADGAFIGVTLFFIAVLAVALFS